MLREFGVSCEMTVASAHRSPARVKRLIAEAPARGVQVFIVGAGAAAHLAGMVAAHTARPVIGVPIDSSPLHGFDALLSTVQMPPGVPVATVAVGKAGATNAGVLAAQILAPGRPRARRPRRGLQARLADKVEQARQARGPEPEPGGTGHGLGVNPVPAHARRPAMKYAILTFGCRVNQADSFEFDEGLRARGAGGGARPKTPTW